MKKTIATLMLADLRLIFRDPTLKTFLFLPVLLFAVFVWLIPDLIAKYDILTPYIDIMLMVGVIENTQMFSFMMSMVFIDEKETGVAKVYGVIPVSKYIFVLMRLVIPYLFTVVVNIILLYIQPLYSYDFFTIMLISGLTGLIVPIYAISLSMIAKNRVQGMVYIKGFNLLVLLPIVALFIPKSLVHLFGILPSHWVFQSIREHYIGHDITIQIILGFLLSIVLLFLSSRIFVKRHFY